ncbi:guanylyl cyclase 1 [Prunus dulcis]|uniref:Guanylyl cyclase 1 n=1 Tax=Prunus dulcis TaxID=3755 RepID=A0A4Y1R1Q1_PRUDU|nr:guanylyl cyclase 1 [Prunus dulcis]
MSYVKVELFAQFFDRFDCGNSIDFVQAEDEEESDGEHSSLVESYPCGQSSSNGKCHVAALPCSHFVEVPHINQLDSWDCGLACLVMVFRTVGIDSCDIQTLAELCCTTSFSYYTVTFGANPNYSGETFYKEQLPNDLARVDTLFQKAREAGVSIQVTMSSYVGMTLLRMSLRLEIRPVQAYTSARSDKLCRKHERVSSTCLEEARKSFGTDEDLLLISLKRSGKQNSSLIQRSARDNIDCR